MIGAGHGRRAETGSGGVARSSGQGGDAEERRYAAPALEKGLDILELLARSPEGMTQSQIAQSLGRSVAEVYRMLVLLERRDYIARRPPDESYRLTMRLAGLAAEYPPTERLAAAAQAVMRRVAADAEQSVHLAVLDGIEIFILAKVDSPGPIGLHVRLGSRHAVTRTASGRLLAAHAGPVLAGWLSDRLFSAERAAVARRRFEARLSAIRRVGYEFTVDETLQGVTSMSAPVIDAGGAVLAALTMPFVGSREGGVARDEAGRILWAGAADISAAVGGRLVEPAFPLSDPEGQAGAAEAD